MTEDAKNPFSKYILFCSAVKTATIFSLFGAQDLNMVHRREQETAEGPFRIAFGSCNDQDHQNNLWPIIESRRPAAFVWGGDAIYAGT
jgi:alkaline phosphatase D